MGPHSSEQGNKGAVMQVAVIAMNCPGFNGASLFRARKPGSISSTCQRYGARNASMGPHSSEQGNRNVVYNSRFMGPRSSEQGNCSESKQQYQRRLQWGLTLPSKETRERVQPPLEMGVTGASMGPHSSEQGNRIGVVLPRVALRSITLQWGLTLPSKETCLGCSRMPVDICRLLQWGLTLPSKETRNAEARRYQHDAVAWASMGPHSSEQGNNADSS